MFSDFSANAILTKSLAKYGKRLTSKDYQNLLNCSRVNDIASYLKNNTSYKNILDTVNEHDIHRGYLESLLENRIFNDMASIFGYSASISEYFANYMILVVTVKEFIHILIKLNSGDETETPVFPRFIQKGSQINFTLLSQAKDYDDFLRAVRNSEYYKILLPFKPSENQMLDLPRIENTLYTHMYTKTFAAIKKGAKGKTRKELNTILTDIVDVQNYINVIRLKKNYHLNQTEIKNLLIPIGFFNSKRAYELLKAESCEEINDGMLKTSIGKRLLNANCAYVDELLLRLKYNSGRYNIRFSSSPIVVAFSYLLLMEIEIINIIHIVEGVRYGLKKSSIQKLLILSE